MSASGGERTLPGYEEAVDCPDMATLTGSDHMVAWRRLKRLALPSAQVGCRSRGALVALQSRLSARAVFAQLDRLVLSSSKSMFRTHVLRQAQHERQVGQIDRNRL